MRVRNILAAVAAEREVFTGMEENVMAANPVHPPSLLCRPSASVTSLFLSPAVTSLYSFHMRSAEYTIAGGSLRDLVRSLHSRSIGSCCLTICGGDTSLIFASDTVLGMSGTHGSDPAGSRGVR